MDIPEFNEDMSFSELYNLYYSLQMQEHTIPLARTFLNIQKGICDRITNPNLKKLMEGKQTLFLPGESLNQLDLFKKNSGKKQVEDYSNQVADQVASIKNVITNKLNMYLDSKEFHIFLDLSSTGGDSGEENIFIKFKDLNPENMLGLYYVVHSDIPSIEFFKEKYGFALKVSEFQEVKNKIDGIRNLHGIKTPRDLVRTINETGRVEQNKKKLTSLAYAIIGEGEIYGFLNRYTTINFGVPAKAVQGMIFPIEEDNLPKGFLKYDRLIIQGKNEDKDSKNKWGLVWTGDLEVHSDNRRYNFSKVRDNVFEEERNFYGGISEERSQEFIERFCAFCLDKFADKSLVSKLKIGFAKKYC